jgi:hypothetical protein
MDLKEIEENVDAAVSGLWNLRKASQRVSSHLVEVNFDSFVVCDQMMSYFVFKFCHQL